MNARSRIPLRVDLRSQTPAYLQIVEQIRARAAAGVLKPGDRLPTMRATAEAAHINFTTVARAYRILDEAGIVSTQHGRGTFVVASPARAGAARRATLRELGRGYAEACARLGATPAEMRSALNHALAGRSAGRRSGSSG